MKMIRYNIKIFIYISAGLFTSSLLSGCSKDWLEAKPDKTIVVPESLSDFQGLLDDSNIMSQFYAGHGEVAADNYYTTDERFGLLPQDYDTDAYIWKKRGRWPANGSWASAYKKVLYDNIILDGLTKIDPATSLSQQEWNNVKGQALFNRAYAFFNLLITYAPPFDGTSQNDLGIPLRTTTDINLPTTRNTVKEGYELIIRDVSEAANLLPEKAKILTRPSKAAAHAFLSRIYLSMGDYEKSLASANACLGLYSSLLDYNTIPESQSFIGRYNSEVLYFGRYTFGRMTSATYVKQELYDMYAADDLRKKRFFKNNPDGTISFKGTYEDAATRLFYGLATDEVYLAKAECLARLGKTGEAMQTLNTLLKARWDNAVPYPKLSASNPEEALVLILTERRKELISRGIRWIDLRRLNKDPRFAVTLTRTVLGQTYTLAPGSPKYTFPIPDEIIEQTGIPQNPGWEN